MKKMFIMFGLLCSLLGSDAQIYSMHKATSASDKTAKVAKKSHSNFKLVDIDRTKDKKYVYKAFEKDFDNLIGGLGDFSIFDDHYKLLLKHRTKILKAGKKRAGIISYNKKGYIYLIYVNPEFRGKGYAQELLTFVEKRAKKLGAKSLTLEVFNYNKPGRKFFKKSGFKFKNKSQSSNLITLGKKI